MKKKNLEAYMLGDDTWVLQGDLQIECFIVKNNLLYKN